MFEEFIYQAHGPAGVVSDRAVFDCNVQHNASASCEGLYHRPFDVSCRLPLVPLLQPPGEH